MSTNIDAALEALYEDEGLTDNLTDGPAKALLAWAESQIKAGADPQQVRKAARAANREEIADGAAAVAAASAALGAGAAAQPKTVLATAPAAVAPAPTAPVSVPANSASAPAQAEPAPANAAAALTKAGAAILAAGGRATAERKRRQPIAGSRRRSPWRRSLRRS